MNNGQHITMCALFLCNGFADLAVSISYYDDDGYDCSDCGENDDEQCTMHKAQHITICALFLCNGFADLVVRQMIMKNFTLRFFTGFLSPPLFSTSLPALHFGERALPSLTTLMV